MMKKQLLLASAILSVIAIPASVTGQGRIKCVEAPIGTEDPDPDTYCPEDYGTDPLRQKTDTSEDSDALAELIAKHDAQVATEPQ